MQAGVGRLHRSSTITLHIAATIILPIAIAHRGGHRHSVGFPGKIHRVRTLAPARYAETDIGSAQNTQKEQKERKRYDAPAVV
jgi:hypothetical protein